MPFNPAHSNHFVFSPLFLLPFPQFAMYSDGENAKVTPSKYSVEFSWQNARAHLWGGQGGLNLPLYVHVPLNPGSRPIFVGSRLFALLLIAKYCIMLHNFSQFLLLAAFKTLSLPESVLETFKVILTFESVDEIL